MKTRLSVAIITLNEERNLAECLASVAFADEIVVVDGGSQDRTCEIARAAGARVIEAPDWLGFGVQKNRAIDACSGDWVLSIDADERVPQDLRDEIQSGAERSRHSMFMRCRAAPTTAAASCAIQAGGQTTFEGCSGAAPRDFRQRRCMNPCRRTERLAGCAARSSIGAFARWNRCCTR